MKGHVVLVTGASRGIGRAAALYLARQGVQVIITGRTIGALEALDDEIKEMRGQAAIVPLDQNDYEAMPRLAQIIFERWGRLDGFVANAGMLGGMAPLPHIEGENFEQVLRVNLISVWHQIKVLDPLLRAAPAGRAVLISSGAAHGKRAFWGGYAVSKAGLEALGRIWADESEQTQLKINMLDPGAVATGMRAEAYPGEDPAGLLSATAMAPVFGYLLSADCGTQGRLYTAREILARL